EGKMRTRSYEDKSGVKRSVMEINADTIEMLDSKQQSQQPQVQPQPQAQYSSQGNGGDGDLPF
ncbi:MAG: single-stranded DNA-binding protein, partial [Rikenellaceae bacterium]|nr:single-stranded DNA-binding protein [Rikenellaceae bacterium]